jgi:hypothetical protein
MTLAHGAPIFYHFPFSTHLIRPFGCEAGWLQHMPGLPTAHSVMCVMMYVHAMQPHTNGSGC